MSRQNKKTNMTVVVLLLIVVAVAIYIYINNKDHKGNKFVNIDTNATSTKNVNFDPLNFTYDIDGEKIVLKNGTSTSDIVPGSAEKLETTVFDKPAVGDLNGDIKNDSAILLVQDSGGTGLFYYLVAVYSDAGVPKNTNSIFIGDRIEPVSVTIKNGQIELNYVDRNPNDPMTADPTIKITKYFEVKNSILEEVK